MTNVCWVLDINLQISACRLCSLTDTPQASKDLEKQPDLAILDSYLKFTLIQVLGVWSHYLAPLSLACLPVIRANVCMATGYIPPEAQRFLSLYGI